MTNLVIREAILKDMPSLLNYEQGIIEFERAFNKDLRSEDVKYYNLKSLIASDNSAVFIGEIDGVIVATGYALIKEGMPQFTYDNYAYLGFMYVSPEHRGKGINAKVIDAAKKWSKSRDINHLRLNVYKDNTSAIKAYEKLGFETEMYEMKLWIE